MTDMQFVPSPKPYMRDTGQTSVSRDKRGDTFGTGNLANDTFALKSKEIEFDTRDDRRDNSGIIRQIACPNDHITLGQRLSGWTVKDWQYFHQERTAIREYDGDQTRGDAERGAILDCVQEFVTRNRDLIRPSRCAEIQHHGSWTDECEICRLQIISNALKCLRLLGVSSTESP
jgi:hypothetical protein